VRPPPLDAAADIRICGHQPDQGSFRPRRWCSARLVGGEGGVSDQGASIALQSAERKLWSARVSLTGVTPHRGGVLAIGE